MADPRVDKIHQLIADRYGGKNKDAAAAWDLHPTLLSKLLNEDRDLGNYLAKIAESESLPVAWFSELQVSQNEPVFHFDSDEPAHMALQLKQWFRQLPEEGPTTRRVSRVVMRALMDYTFSAARPPSEAWKAVMNHLDEFEASPGRNRRAG